MMDKQDMTAPHAGSEIEWKPIPGHEGYEASNQGTVRNAVTGQVLTSNVMKGGYARVSLRKDGKLVQPSVHRLVAAAFFGPREGLEVNHKNGVKDDNRVENLEWVTKRENIIHSYYDLGQNIHGVIAENVKTGFTKTYPSVRAAARDGFISGNIYGCLAGRYLTHKGHRFHSVKQAPVATTQLEQFTNPSQQDVAEIGTLKDFRMQMLIKHKRRVTEQEIWDAGVQAGLRAAPVAAQQQDVHELSDMTLIRLAKKHAAQPLSTADIERFLPRWRAFAADVIQAAMHPATLINEGSIGQVPDSSGKAPQQDERKYTVADMERYGKHYADARDERPQQEAGQARELPPLPAPHRHGGTYESSPFEYYTANQMREYARAAQSAPAQPTVPEGFALVPRKATEGMIRAAFGWRESDSRAGLIGDADMYERIYYAMISAALASSPDVPGEWERLLTQVIPYRLKLIERGECVDASVEAIRECVARLLASAPAQPTVPEDDSIYCPTCGQMDGGTL